MSWEFDILYGLQDIHNTVLDQIMKFFTAFGNGGIFWILLALFFIFFYKKYRVMGVQMGAAMLLSLIIGNLILKNIVRRDRPCWIDTEVVLLVKNPWDYSFPSGHSLNAFSAATVMFLHNKKLGIPALVLAAVIGFSRLYLFVHFPTDVLAGILIGIADAVILCVLFNKYKDSVELLKKI